MSRLLSSRPGLGLAVGALLIGLAVGLGIGLLAAGDDAGRGGGDPPAAATTATEPAPVTEPATTTSTTTSTTAPEPPILVLPRQVDVAEWPAIAAALAPVGLPSTCGRPWDEPVSVPNAARAYRGGVHQGIDFICEEPGHTAVAALAGRVLIANSSFEDPSPVDRDAVLGEAIVLGRTPSWILDMLYGRFVVLDHGVVDGVGHVVTLYAHLESIDPAVTPGVLLAAGAPLGEIGDTGTGAGASGVFDPRSLHLHWELHVDEVFLGAGLDFLATRQLYLDLFGLSGSS